MAADSNSSRTVERAVSSRRADPDPDHDQSGVTTQLFTSEHFYESLFRAMVEGVVVQDADGAIMACNESAHRILGLTEDQLHGRTSVDPRWRTVHEDGSPFPGTEHPAMVTLRTGEPSRAVVMGVHTPDGELRWIEVNSELLPAVNGQAAAVLSTFHDVTPQVVGRRALEESEERFALAVQGSNSGIWDWYDVNSSEEWWSPRFYELLGYDPHEIEPSLEAFEDLLHPDDIEDTSAAVQRLMDGYGEFDVEYRLRDKSGAYRWFLARAALQRSEDGAPRRMVGSITDIHDRHSARDEVERFFELSPELVALADYGGHFLRVNPAFTTELGYSEAELLARPFLDLVHPDDLDSTVTAMSALSEGRVVSGFQNRYRHRNGHWVWLSWSANGDAAKVYAIARNVTEERRARDELRRKAHELELTNEELEQFAFVASHDLREPLRTLTSYAELMAETYSDVLDDDGREFLSFMTEAAERLRALIDALLGYSRLNSEGEERRPTDLNSVVGGVTRDLDAAISDAGASIEVESLPNVRCDPALLGRVFQNLIANAIKFNESAAPHVLVTAERRRLGWEIRVADNGIGIGEVHRERVFEVFKRLHGPRKYPGTGMGLAICKRIVQQHGGTMWCTANPGGGSIFHFTLFDTRT